MSVNTTGKITNEQAKLHRVVMPLLGAMYSEFKDFSRKKPEGVLNANKVRVVNRLLGKCRKVLESETSLQFLDLLDEDSLPQYSDVILMLSQYVGAMEQFKETYYVRDELGFDRHWSWSTSD